MRQLLLLSLAMCSVLPGQTPPGQPDVFLDVRRDGRLFAARQRFLDGRLLTFTAHLVFGVFLGLVTQWWAIRWPTLAER